MAISEDFLLELKSRNRIEEVVSSYINLKKGGRNPKGLCPFHNEKTPSFTLYPENGSFYCFGCGVGGDVIRFIRLIENLDYIDAVRFLAQRAGMAMPAEGVDDSLSRLKNKIYAINRETARFFNSVLMSPEGKVGYDYFVSRGLSESDMRHFGLGFSPDAWSRLRDHLKEKGFSYEDMLAANVVSKSSRNGSFYDRFRNRIMFPIIDVRGNVIAFGGRKLPQAEGAKYINTSDTPVYRKSQNVYALNFAKNHCSERIILCEGYMDVIALHRSGIVNAVAPLGTAFTEEQARLLCRYTNEIILCFDSDDAGQKAVERAVGILSGAGARTRIIKVPSGKDPDEFIRSNGRDGPAKFRALIDNALSIVEYRIEKASRRIDSSTDEGRIQLIETVAGILAEVVSPVERDVYAGRLSEKFGVSKDAILRLINDDSRKNRRRRETREIREIIRPKREDPINREKPFNLRAANAEEGLIAVLLKNPDFMGRVNGIVSAEDFTTSFNRRVFEVIAERQESGKSLDLTALNSDFSSEEIGRIAEIVSKGAARANTLDECVVCAKIMKEEKLKIKVGQEAFKDDRDFFDKIKELANNKAEGVNENGR